MTEAPAKTATIANPKGLHARPSAAVAEIVGGYEARVLIGYRGEWEEADSILGLLTLGACHGAEVAVSADGPQAEAAIAAVVSFLEQGVDKL